MRAGGGAVAAAFLAVCFAASVMGGPLPGVSGVTQRPPAALRPAAPDWWSVPHLFVLLMMAILAAAGGLAFAVEFRRAPAELRGEPGPEQQLLDRRHRLASRAAGWVAALTSAFGLIFVWLKQGSLSGFADSTPKGPNTAAGLLLIGVALAVGARRPALARACGIGAALAGALTVAGHFLGAPVTLDAPLVAGYPAGLQMTLASAFGLVLLGSSAFCSGWRRGAVTAQMLAMLSAVLATVDLAALLYGASTPDYPGRFHVMSALTAFTMMVLACGLLVAHPDRGPVAALTSAGPGGMMARRVLPVGLGLRAAASWFFWQRYLWEGHGAPESVTLFGSMNLLLFVLLVWVVAGLLNRLDVQRSRALSALCESQERYRTVVESLPQMVWTCLPDGRCDYLSRQWVHYTGRPAAEQLDFGWIGQVHPEDREAIESRWLAACESGTSLDATYRIRRADGAYRWFRALAMPLRDGAGRITKWFGTSTDIDRLKTAEDALLESEARFRQLADAMPQIVWTARPDGGLDYFNRRSIEYTGISFERMKGSGWQAVLHPDDVQYCLNRWTRSVASGEPYEVEYRLRRAADGVYRWHLGRAAAVRDAQGAIVRWFGTCTDIEDHKRAQASILSLNGTLEERVRERTRELARANEDLAGAEARLRGVLESATQVSIIATGLDHVIRIFNPGAERMLGYDAAEMIGLQTPGVLHDAEESRQWAVELAEELGRPVEAVHVFSEHARQGRSDERECTYIRKDGTRLRVKLAVTPLLGPGRDILGFLGIATDITGHVALENQLRVKNEKLASETQRAEEANRAKSRFLAAMSHEIRTPMNAILGMADVLWDTPLTGDQRQYVEIFQRAGANLLNLLNDILDLSKIEAAGIELDSTDFDLDRVLAECVELTAPQARAKGIGLLVRLVPGCQTSLRGDRARLRQILINLLGNAVKFTAAGEIVLTAGNHPSGERGHLELSVSDTGIGIPANKIETIFRDFEQADSSTTRQFGGTGLGLSISRRLVERMGGALSAVSEVGKGSTFRFDVRLECPAGSEKASVLRPMAGGRALIVEGNATNRGILAETLAAWGLDCDAHASADDAMNGGGWPRYIVALIDDRALGAAGLPFGERLRTGAVPVIVVSGDHGDSGTFKGSGLPILGHVAPPVERAKLARLVERAIAPGPVEEAGPETERAPMAYPASGPLRILIAEDVAMNRFLLGAYLKDTPHELVYAEDGRQAVERFADGRFDLVFMDMQMPVMDGLAAVAAIRSFERERGVTHARILALTASALAEDIEASFRAGCDGHLSKPVSKAQVLAAVDEAGARTHSSGDDLLALAILARGGASPGGGWDATTVSEDGEQRPSIET